MTRQLHLSASSIGAFKACPTRFRLKYIEGVRKIEDTDAQRMGTNWHALHENYHANNPSEDPGGAYAAALGYLNDAYATVPETKTFEEWATERTVLAYSFAAYCWYYAEDTFNVIQPELEFDLPLHHPKSGMPLATKDVIRAGKIDALAKDGNKIFKLERKSTSSSLDADSDYWAKLKMDTQVGFYDLAVVDLHASGQIEIGEDDVIEGTLYDVWRKPSIRPKFLTQGESKSFVADGEYKNGKFTVHVDTDTPEGDPIRVKVDGTYAEVKPGAKDGTFAIKETPEMFGQRLLLDCMERPEHYFARREIVRTDKERKTFRTEIYNIYQAMKNYRQTGHWFKNEQQCEATFKCEYCPICYYNVPYENGETPVGFKRIFEGKASDNG